MIVAPPAFGTGARQVVLTVDAGSRGALVMMDAHGRTREIATLPDGPNPIVAVPASTGHGKLAAPRGLYVTDTNSTNVFFASATSLARYAGDLIVGTELKAIFWAVAPHGRGFQAQEDPDDAAGEELQPRRGDVRGRLARRGSSWTRAGVSRRCPARSTRA